MADLTDTSPDRTLGVYELGELVGRGGMGEVYRAFDRRLERPVALKVLSPRLAEDESFRARLLRESRLAAGLDHPNVVPVYDAGEADGALYIAMRYVDGTDLRRLLLAEGPLSPERAVAIAGQIAAALDAAHARGLVHRDVKPSNVLIDTGEGREHCYLADFGLSQSVSQGPATDGELLGTVDYVAPEQIRGDAIDGRADIYAFGCLFYEMLTGERPFAGSSDIATIYAHLEEEPAPASERRPELPPAVDVVLATGDGEGPGRPARHVCRAGRRRTRSSRGRRRSRRRAPARARPRGRCPRRGGRRRRGGRVCASAGCRAESARRLARPHRLLLAPVSERLSTSVAPTHVAASPGQLWFSSGGSLWHLGSGSDTPEQVDTVGPIYDLAALGDTVFVAREGRSFVEGVVGSYSSDGFRGDGVALKACSLAAGPSVGVWAADCQGVHRLESTPGACSCGRNVPIPQPFPATSATTRWCLCDMATGAGSLWVVGDPDDPRVLADRAVGPHRRCDRPSGRSEEHRGGRWIGLDHGRRSTTSCSRWTRPRIGSSGGSPSVAGAAGIVGGDGAVWVAGQLDGTVTRIDPATGEVTDRIHVGGRPTELAFGDGGVWAAVDERS